MRIKLSSIESYGLEGNKMYLLLSDREQALEMEYEGNAAAEEGLEMLDEIFSVKDEEDDD